MAKLTLTAQVAALTSLVESLVAAQGKPAAAQAKSPTFATKTNGAEFPCAADEPCSRKLKTEKRAKVHGIDAGGHEAR